MNFWFILTKWEELCTIVNDLLKVCGDTTVNTFLLLVTSQLDAKIQKS